MNQRCSVNNCEIGFKCQSSFFEAIRFTQFFFLGIKTIAESFAKDEKGYFGCKKASEETKKKIVDELMKGDKIGIEIRKAVEKLTKNKNTGGTVQTLVSKGIMMAIGGVLGYMLKASMNTFEQEL